MMRAICGFSLGVMLVWATACGSDDDKEKTTTNKICTEDTECDEPFFECEHVTSTTTGTCTKPCESNTDCPANHSCQTGTSIGLEPSCLQLCSSAACPASHTCTTNADEVQICIPTAWTTSG